MKLLCRVFGHRLMSASVDTAISDDETVVSTVVRCTRCGFRKLIGSQGVVQHRTSRPSRRARYAINVLTGPMDYDVGESPGEVATEYEHRIDEAVRALKGELDVVSEQ